MSFCPLVSAGNPQATARREELVAMAIAADAMMSYAERNADFARSMADAETDPARKTELLDIAEVCSWVPAHAPPEASPCPDCC